MHGAGGIGRAQMRIGQVLDGKWRLDSLLGVGGSAAVYAATHRNTKRAAVKILHAELSTHAELVARFVREGYVANKIGHPGTAQVLDDDRGEDGSVYIVMELLEGQSLDRFTRPNEVAMPLRDVIRLMDELLEVLTAAHAHGVVHRDIKPANLFLTTEGRLKVLDFGIARLAEPLADGSATQTGMTIGTPAFMPPEQARGRWQQVDARTDLWAVGATMFALLTQRRLRSAETANEELLLAMTAPVQPVAQVEPRVPPEIAHIVDKALSLDMDSRWQDARAMQQALREAAKVLASRPETTLPAPTGPLASPPSPQTITMGDPSSAPLVPRQSAPVLPALPLTPNPLTPNPHTPNPYTPNPYTPPPQLTPPPGYGPGAGTGARSGQHIPDAFAQTDYSGGRGDALTTGRALLQSQPPPRPASKGPLFLGLALGLVGVATLGFAAFRILGPHASTSSAATPPSAITAPTTAQPAPPPPATTDLQPPPAANVDPAVPPPTAGKAAPPPPASASVASPPAVTPPPPAGNRPKPRPSGGGKSDDPFDQRF